MLIVFPIIMDKKIVAVACENLGIKNITSDASATLINDSEMRIRQVIGLAINFMKRSHRSQLQSKDIKRAMKLCGLDNIYGFPSSVPLKYKNLPNDEDAWIIDDAEIQLSEFLTSKISPPFDVSLHSHWLAINGKVPNIPENHTENVVEEEIKENVPNDKILIGNVTHQLSLQQQLYYNTILESLQTGKKLQVALDSLYNDSSITQVVPYLARSFYQLVFESNSLELLDRAMKMLGALALNPHLNLEPYLHQIIPTLLSGVVRTNLLEEGHWVFRRNTADIVAKVCEKYIQYYDDLKARVIQLYVSVLEDPSKPACTHYGAIQGINAFGAQTVKTVLVSLLGEYIPHVLEPRLRSQDSFMWNQVKGALIEGCRKVVKENPAAYSGLEEFFGNELAIIES
ncbi:unnamed protein product [Blepharisma stoltei]|uniref:TATA box binding protein associated factor (TAF) histone-like fold domain-containing protein n=1 Tax=Blepharisma stoltei TaxID=1481888 RepID=A0AAU9JJX9_9CILI|nr:unnamed protein product [Blepharisma stoltei]